MVPDGTNGPSSPRCRNADDTAAISPIPQIPVSPSVRSAPHFRSQNSQCFSILLASQIFRSKKDVEGISVSPIEVGYKDYKTVLNKVIEKIADIKKCSDRVNIHNGTSA